MTNCKIIEILNRETDNKYSFKMKNATLKQGGSICVLEIYYKDGIILSMVDRMRFQNLILENMPSGFEYDIKFIKNFVNVESIIPTLEDYFKTNCPAIIHKVKDVNVADEVANVFLLIDEKSFERYTNKRIQSALEEFLTEYFCFNFSIQAEPYQFVEERTIAVDNDLDIDVSEPLVRTIDVTDLIERFLNALEK